ncbi:response regulator [Ruegeria sp. A3M17]|uniref:response regulator n=1 Tax=Ruegeria sp. A3M17 TaxID=2267229 RepID=UPI000DE92900|nr:response regulator transcription factor [Ruegeria sp. A3M17]RBW52563.1 DNA-binding response regulator [Ruegeria sp. A3M17]
MDNQKTHILVCDDEIDVREMLQEYLGKRGFKVSAASGGEELREKLSVNTVDVIIMDINMPKEDGLSILTSLRPENTTPVIMLTAAGDAIDRVIGLEMGADDYLGKPVDLRELEARIKAILRRESINTKATTGNSDGNEVPFGNFTLDREAAKLLAADGSEVQLTAMEYSLLKVFAENRGRVLNRDQLLEQAHDRTWDPFDRSIDIRISRLRRKLEANPEKPEIIRTVRGIGYLYDPK